MKKNLYYATILSLLTVSLFAPRAFSDTAITPLAHQPLTISGLQNDVLSVTTWFPSTSATCLRMPNGHLITSLQSQSGDHLGTLTSNTESLSTTLTLNHEGVRYEFSKRLEPTSGNWMNLQLQLLWLDLNRPSQSQPTSFIWHEGFLRHTTTSNHLRNEGRIPLWEKETEILASEVIYSETRAFSRNHVANTEGSTTPGSPTFTSALFDLETTKPIGFLAWYGNTKTLTWRLPDRDQGNVSPSTFSGEWPFVPDLSWANLQLYSSYQLSKSYTIENTVGCDGLHWLDNTIFRPCCDRHDLCYEKEDPVCTAKSWWIIGSSWSCIKCNLVVVACFVTFGGFGGGGDKPEGDLSDSNCTADPVCPAWCAAC